LFQSFRCGFLAPPFYFTRKIENLIEEIRHIFSFAFKKDEHISTRLLFENIAPIILNRLQLDNLLTCAVKFVF